jgi:hypothetical protein
MQGAGNKREEESPEAGSGLALSLQYLNTSQQAAGSKMGHGAAVNQLQYGFQK